MPVGWMWWGRHLVFWHGDNPASGEILLGILLGRDERVRLVYGLLIGAFYMDELFGLAWCCLNDAAMH